MNQERLNLLLHKYHEGALSTSERTEVDEWFHGLNLGGMEFETWAKKEHYVQNRFADFQMRIQEPAKTYRLWPRIAAAASIIIAMTAGGYFALHHTSKPSAIVKLKPGTFKNDVIPGDKAILTLSNRSKVAVSSAKIGLIASQGATAIHKNSNGTLVYQSNNSTTAVAYNTLTTLRGGGKHELILADGTLAVLDAGSSITYPTAFNGKERQVKITGQVYFEVKHDAAKPFSVLVKDEVIRDIGTHFNINAFDDEGIVKTTLAEGSISVSASNQSITLKPGQQAYVNSGRLAAGKADLGVVLAWKNDYFRFNNNATLAEVMRQVSRWYDLDIVYQGNSKHYSFGGDIPRNSKLTDILKILQYSGLQFAVDGKKLIVFQ